MIEWELHEDESAGFGDIEWELYDDQAAVFGSDEYIEVMGKGVAEYEGPYQATPLWSVQEFATNGLLMTDDFTVDSMLELEVPNDAGGLTLTI